MFPQNPPLQLLCVQFIQQCTGTTAGLLVDDNGKMNFLSEKQSIVQPRKLTFCGLLMLMTCVRVPVPMGSKRLPEGDCSVNWNDCKDTQDTPEELDPSSHQTLHVTTPSTQEEQMLRGLTFKCRTGEKVLVMSLKHTPGTRLWFRSHMKLIHSPFFSNAVSGMPTQHHPHNAMDFFL